MVGIHRRVDGHLLVVDIDMECGAEILTHDGNHRSCSGLGVGLVVAVVDGVGGKNLHAGDFRCASSVGVVIVAGSERE